MVYSLKEKRKNIGLFLINTVIIFCVFGLFVFSKHYSSDDFFCYYDQMGEANAVIFSSYRICLGVIYIILSYLKINVVTYQILFGVLMLICFSASVTLITITINNIISIQEGTITDFSLLAIIIGSLMLIINVFISEWVWFSLGYIQWGLSVLFSTLAAVYLIRNEIKDYVLTFFFLFLAAGCYQISISIYVFVVMLFITCNEKGKISKNAIKYTVKAAIPAILSILGNMLCTKLLVAFGVGYSGSRADFGIQQILEKLCMLLKNEKVLWNTGLGLLPKYFMCIICGAYIFLLIYLIITGRFKWNILAVLVTLLAGIAVMCMPVVLQESFYQPARMIVPITGVFMVLHIVIIVGMRNKKKVLQCAVVIGIVYLGVNIVEIQRNTVDCIITCALEKKEAEDIVKYIQNYEMENNCIVENIAFLPDEHPVYKYTNEIANWGYGGEMASRSILVDWSNIQLFNFYSGNNYNKSFDNVKDYVSEKKNYEYFSPNEQIYIENGTAYIYIY